MDDLIASVPSGKYFPIGVGANVQARYQYDLEINLAPPKYPFYAYPVEEPCWRYSQLGILLEQTTEVPELFDLETQLAIYGENLDQLLDNLETLAGIGVQFVPGYDCYDALVNGVTGWNAVGCTADLIGAGITTDLLRTINNLQVVVRKGDDVVGAVRHIDSVTFADELAEAVAQTCSSFAPNTEVLLANGTTTPIDRIATGDQVVSYDLDNNEQTVGEVTAAWSHPDRVATATFDSGSIQITADHPVWNNTDQTWQAIENVDPGDTLLAADGSEVTFVSLDTGTGDLTNVYDLSVSGHHNFYVQTGTDSILVHNEGSPCALAARLGGNAGEVAQKVPELADPILDYANEFGDEAASALVNALKNKNLDDLTTAQANNLADILNNGGDDAARWIADKSPEAAAALCNASTGGSYTLHHLVDGVIGPVLYVGTTVDFVSRRTDHLANPRLTAELINDEGVPIANNDGDLLNYDLHLDPVHELNDHDVRRGLEQDLFDTNWHNNNETISWTEARAQGSRNRQRPMAMDRDVLPARLQYAEAFKKACK